MFDDSTGIVLEKAIEGSYLRHKAILNNIANVNTPNYKRVDVDFKSSLNSAVKNLDSGQYAGNENNLNSPKISESNDPTTRLDGNNVDIDKEMTALAQNSLEYNTYMTLISKKMKVLKNIITEGKKWI